jgi:hypothetical protein
MKQINMSYLLRFLSPIDHFAKDNREFQNELVAREETFIKQNDDIPLSDLMKKAETEFGLEVAYFERYYQFRHLKGIYTMLKFFLILTVLSIISTVIYLMMQLV